MIKLHDENFYTYQYDLLDESHFPDLAAVQPIVREPNQPGGASPWSGGLAEGRTGQFRQRQVGEQGIPEPPRRPGGTVIWDPPLATIPPNAPLPEGAEHWLKAVGRWQLGIYELQRRRHNSAAFAFDECQQHAVTYFDIVRKIPVTGAGIRARVSNVLSKIASDLDPNPQPPPTPLAQRPRTLRRMLELRRGATTLGALHFLDWNAPVMASANVRERPIGTPVSRLNANAIEVLQHLAAVGLDAKIRDHFYLVHQKLDYFMLVLMSVFVPLARAELERDQRRYEVAVDELEWVLANAAANANPAQFIVNEPIELPFVRLLLAECLLEQGDAEYKAETPVSPLPPIPPPPARLPRYDWMKARTSYERAIDHLKPLGNYDAQVTAAVTKLEAAANAPERELAKLGKEILIDSMKPLLQPGETPGPAQERLVGRKNTAATAPLLQIGDASSRETNPRVFALLLQANARLKQLKADFNWLGYPDDYTPPWRFQFLLDRARYFSEHAKQAQRDYLNFLVNAEREEFQEKSAAQAVALEGANIAIEDARVTQAVEEHVAAQKSHELSELVANNSQTIIDSYAEFSEVAENLSDTSLSERVLRVFGAIGSGLASGGKAGAVAGGFGGIASEMAGYLGEERQRDIQRAQRNYEKKSLELARDEANKAKEVSEQQVKVTQAAVTVANLQRQAAILRHEFAVETVAYLAGRKLNAEQWFRLAIGIRAIAEVYLRYAIEIAFLSEQAYEFEADKLLNVIRFDYDLSELGEYLAGDFLLKDLDTLEHDLIISQRERQQHVRYIVSMAREFPEALQALRDTGRVTFSIVLEQIERRFPGLILARLGAVDVLPIALMDQSRFSACLTHQGFSRMRSRPTLGADPAQPWPAKPRMHGPETAIYSGLSRQDAASIFPVATSGQRNAFEGRGAAGAWEIDMAMEENQVVPGSLADMLITFNLSGYYDAQVRTEQPAPGPDVLTTFISARQTFPDNFYEFNRTGRMIWSIRSEFLTTRGRLGRLRNVGVTLLPEAMGPCLSGLMSYYRVRFFVEKDSDGSLNLRMPQPSPRLELATASNDTLMITAKEVGLDAAAKRIWGFGDGSGFKAEPPAGEGPVVHTYAKPGSYKLTMRATHHERLIEAVADVAVSRRDGLLWAPLNAPPELRPAPGGGSGSNRKLKVAGSLMVPEGEQGVEGTWWLDGRAPLRSTGVDEVSFELAPGSYSLDVRVVRSIKSNILCDQKSVPSNGAPFDMRLSLTTNVRFNEKGEEINGTPGQPERNLLAKQLFNSGNLSPVDNWAFELPLQYAGQQGAIFAPFSGVTSRDEPKYELGRVQDLLLALEYEVE